jgi:diaminopimelate decarboxylase
MSLERYPLTRIADQVGTPFYLYDADILRQKLSDLQGLTDGPQLSCRYAVKANSARKVLAEVRAAGLWIEHHHEAGQVFVD